MQTATAKRSARLLLKSCDIASLSKGKEAAIRGYVTKKDRFTCNMHHHYYKSCPCAALAAASLSLSFLLFLLPLTPPKILSCSNPFDE